MAVEAAAGPMKGKLVVRNIGLLLSGDLAQPILDADTIVAVDGRIAAIGKAKDVDTDKPDLVIDAKGCAVMASALTPIGSLGRPGRCTSPADTKVVTPPLTHESIQPSWFCLGVQSPNTGWQWLSIRPGATAQPLASITRSGLSVSTPFALPIAVRRPSTAVMVSASRIGCARSPDSSRPMLRTTSLPCMGPAAASTAIWRSSTSQAQR